LRGIGLASAKRHPVVPDVPTYAENGIADFHAASWVGFFVPSKTDSKVIARLNGAINEVIKEAAVQDRLKAFALEPMYGNPAEATAFFNSEAARWGKMVTTLGMSIDK
jgi:tripartite-type tricarboxylate transporter receptor subunit TctC